MLNEVLKICKMIADVKNAVFISFFYTRRYHFTFFFEQEIKDLVAVYLTNVYKKRSTSKT